jgi:hypothetical protein
MQRPRGDAGRLDAGEHRMESAALGQVEQRVEQQRADTFAAAVAANPTTAPSAAPSPARGSGSAGSTATMALNAPDRAASHCTWSSTERGTRSNVAVVCSTSWL